MPLPRLNSSRRGQAMIESLIVLVLLIFILFWVMDYLWLAGTRLLMDHATVRAIRGVSVGFNNELARRNAQLSMIPFSGKRVIDLFGEQMEGEEDWDEAEIDRLRIQNYLAGAATGGVPSLYYERWYDLRFNISFPGVDKIRGTMVFAPTRFSSGDLSRLYGVQDVDESMRLRASNTIENHASLYLER